MKTECTTNILGQIPPAGSNVTYEFSFWNGIMRGSFVMGDGKNTRKTLGLGASHYL
jgi:hypothetical protein